MGTPPGLQTDCEALLSRFQETDSVRFEDFTELWRNMKFGTIFCMLFPVNWKSLWKEMLNVHDHYQNMKHVISVDKSNPDKALSLIKDDFLDNIKNIVLEHQQWHKDRKNPSLKSKINDGEEKTEGNSQETERCERAESLAKIKSKAFSVVIQASKSRRHRQVKLDSSDSDSASGQGQVKATKKKEKKERLKPAGRKMSFRNKGNVQNIHKEDKPLSLSMPVITEEEEENESLSGTEFTASKRRRKR
ncbi:snRNA-activating protein complex subunit 1 [Cebus imitator]|uniref:snRNA-activating protein complex subunit 1 n=1 Tax=Cebus imitator TaxID=2715852 RepID=UPI00189871CA|nr:snRNA-activating protein complex subunit 1 [Cebus imitator]